MRTRTLSILLVDLILVSLLLSGCAPAAIPTTGATAVPSQASQPVNPDLILATTTSTRDSGLLDVLLPLFEQRTGYQVKMIAVGSGQALSMGQEGNVDVMLVHSPTAEKTFMEGGFGKERLLIAHNDFIIVGPESDPAKISGMTSAADAFAAIANAKAIFVSRGDDSGTNKAELTLWNKVKITPPGGEWYLSSGQGMGDTLRIASEKAGYTFTDRATYLALKATLQLIVLVEGDKALLNIYHVITVNPEKWPKVNSAGAKAFADFLISPDTQKVIGEFGKDKYGQALFIADAGKAE